VNARSSRAVPVAAAVSMTLVVVACTHDWDSYDPRATTSGAGGATSSKSSTSTGFTTSKATSGTNTTTVGNPTSTGNNTVASTTAASSTGTGTCMLGMIGDPCMNNNQCCSTHCNPNATGGNGACCLPGGALLSAGCPANGKSSNCCSGNCSNQMGGKCN